MWGNSTQWDRKNGACGGRPWILPEEQAYVSYGYGAIHALGQSSSMRRSTLRGICVVCQISSQQGLSESALHGPDESHWSRTQSYPAIRGCWIATEINVVGSVNSSQLAWGTNDGVRLERGNFKFSVTDRNNMQRQFICKLGTALPHDRNLFHIFKGCFPFQKELVI